MKAPLTSAATNSLRYLGREKLICTACARTTSAVKKLVVCAGCGEVKYCSRECQKIDWKAGHRDACETMAAAKLEEDARKHFEGASKSAKKKKKKNKKKK